MLNLEILCVGGLKEDYFRAAAQEYEKRLGAYAKVEILELKEGRIAEAPSPAEIRAVLEKEADAILAAIPAVLTPILMPKYLTVSKEGSLTEEYYGAVAETNHDVLFVGDCEIFESFVPAVLWKEYGISSYLRGGAQQLPWHSYYMLEDALRYETPRAVVFNVYALKYGEPQKEAYNRMALDGMEWSPVKAEAIKASMTEEEMQQLVELFNARDEEDSFE